MLVVRGAQRSFICCSTLRLLSSDFTAGPASHANHVPALCMLAAPCACIALHVCIGQYVHLCVIVPPVMSDIFLSCSCPYVRFPFRTRQHQYVDVGLLAPHTLTIYFERPLVVAFQPPTIWEPFCLEPTPFLVVAYSCIISDMAARPGQRYYFSNFFYHDG